MLLHDNDLTYKITVNNSSDIIKDELIQQLLHNLDDDYTLSSIDSDISFDIEVLYNNQVVDTARFTDYTRITE